MFPGVHEVNSFSNICRVSQRQYRAHPLIDVTHIVTGSFRSPSLVDRRASVDRTDGGVVGRGRVLFWNRFSRLWACKSARSSVLVFVKARRTFIEGAGRVRRRRGSLPRNCVVYVVRTYLRCWQFVPFVRRLSELFWNNLVRWYNNFYKQVEGVKLYKKLTIYYNLNRKYITLYLKVNLN